MKIDAVRMTREIRDRISREISGMTTAERIEYFRKGARECEARMKREASGREARLKALGIFGTDGPTASEEDSGVGENPVAGEVSQSDAHEPAPTETAVSAKPGSAPD